MIDVAELVARGFESKDLDYKSPMAWNEKDKRACCEIVKDCLAMANTQTGYDYGHLVIGVRELPTGFSIASLSDQQAKSWDTTRLNNFLKNYTESPINTTMRKSRINGNNVIVIDVPRFFQEPHICKKDYPGVLNENTLYVRTDSNESAPARAPDIRKLFEFIRQPKELPAAVPTSRVPASIDAQQSEVRYYGPNGLMIAVYITVENGLDIEVRMRKLVLDIEMVGNRLGCRFLKFQHYRSAEFVESVSDIAVPARQAIEGWAHFNHRERIRISDFKRFLFTVQAIGEPEQVCALEPCDWGNAKIGQSKLVMLPSE